MSEQPWIMYTFADHKIENPDGTRPATVQGNVEFAALYDEANAPKFALTLSNGSGAVATPALPGLAESAMIELGIDIWPAGDAPRMTIVSGEAVPYRLFVENTGDAYRVGAAVHTQRGWLEVVADTTIPRKKWSTISLVGTDGDFMLFVNTKVVARRVLAPLDVRTPTGDGGFVVNGVAPKFVGNLGTFQVDDWADLALSAAASAARTQGIGEITSKYLDLGGAKGPFKQPTGPEVKIAGGRSRTFAGGMILWHPSSGAHEVHNAILARYVELEGPEGPLGFPTSDEGNAATKDARRSRFRGGAIYWSAGTGAHEVVGDIFLHYLGLGEDGSSFGLPVSGEQTVADGRVSKFKGGRLYWSSGTGAFGVSGAILEHYLALGGPADLGFPLTDEQDILDKNGKSTGGKLSRFEGPTIYWSKSTGARAVRGAIRTRYEALGGPQGELGFPRTDEMELNGTEVRYSDFEHGVIAWKPGVAAMEFTAFTLKLGLVTTGKIKDRVNTDHTAELVTYHWVKVDSDVRADGIRLPGGHAGTSYDIKRTFTISHVHPSTKIWLKINAVDYDPITDNDFLASHEATFSLANFFGQLDGSPPGAFIGVPATSKGGDAYSLDTVHFSYSLLPEIAIDPNKPFREQYWWNCGNPATLDLTLEQYASTFRDVSQMTNFVDKARHPFEYLYYEGAYRRLASKGNCFGMCLEALYARKNLSIFPEPIHAIHTTKDGTTAVVPVNNVEPGFLKVINHKHGYQIGASAIRWIVSRFLNWDAFQALDVYAKVKSRLKQGDPSVLCMAKIGGSGHAVLPYDFKDGAGTKQDPHRLYVADPNIPFSSKQKSKDSSYVAIYGDNTFEFFGSLDYKSDKPAKGLLPTTVLLEIPFHRLAEAPRTPFWEILAAVAFIGCFIVLGDAGDEQVSSGGKNLYNNDGGQRRVVKNAIASVMPVPAVDAAGHAGRMLMCQGTLPTDLTMAVRGTKAGHYHRVVATPHRVIELDAPTQKGEADALRVDGLAGRGAALSLTTGASKKRVKFVYGTSFTNHGPPERRFIVDMQVASGTPALLTVEPDERGVLVRPSGPASKVGVTCESYVKGQWARSYADCGLVPAGEWIRVRPQSWTKAGCGFVVERAKNLDSRNVVREVVAGDDPDHP